MNTLLNNSLDASETFTLTPDETEKESEWVAALKTRRAGR